MDKKSNDGWSEYKLVILQRLDTIEENFTKSQDETRNSLSDLTRGLIELRSDLKNKSSFWGATGGILSATSLLIMVYLGHIIGNLFK